MIVTNGVCIDSITVNAPTCDKPVGSIGDFIWKDVNDNGLQDLPAEKGVSGVKLNLYAASGGTKTGPVLQTKTTDVNGLYLFTGLMAGSYIVEIDKTSLKDTCAITPKKDVGANGSDATDSDFDATSGLSQVVVLNPVFNPTTPAEILATNNLTVDAGLVKVCIPPTRAVRAFNPTCTTAGRLQLFSTNGDKYGISKGNTYTGPAYASATAVPGTLPANIKTNISHAADSTWTIRVFNKANDCFKDTTVTVKALVKDATVTVANGFPACRSNGTAYTIKFTKSPAASVVTAKNVATGASIPVTGDSVANIPLTVASVRLIVTNGVCIDSITVNAPTCDKPVGSIGDFIWKDVNDNGLQDLPAEKGVSGVKLNLYAASGGTKTGPVLQTKTTDVNGLYLFTGLMAGSYIVEIDKTSLKDTCAITPKKDVGANGSDATDSDFDATSGLSQVVVLNPVFNPTTPAEILATNNLTVDAGLVKVCIPPTRAVRAFNPTCTTAGRLQLFSHQWR
ncbi:MAG: SdrD B-like domain-containing protein [Spirosomataceae bacterium]